MSAIGVIFSPPPTVEGNTSSRNAMHLVAYLIIIWEQTSIVKAIHGEIVYQCLSTVLNQVGSPAYLLPRMEKSWPLLARLRIPVRFGKILDRAGGWYCTLGFRKRRTVAFDLLVGADEPSGRNFKNLTKLWWHGMVTSANMKLSSYKITSSTQN